MVALLVVSTTVV